jgi:hypothetical protein
MAQMATIFQTICRSFEKVYAYMNEVDPSKFLIYIKKPV